MALTPSLALTQTRTESPTYLPWPTSAASSLRPPKPPITLTLTLPLTLPLPLTLTLPLPLSRPEPLDAARALCEMASQRGSMDNITVLVVNLA